MANEDKVQGEGDYEAARRFRKRSENYVANNDVEKAALRAAPQTSREAEDLEAAEAAGKKRAKGEDPALRPRSAPRVEPSTGGKASQK
ncbi:MAG: hypothetical protein WDO72_00600 [Pseudomonadota bacterium]